MTVSSEMIYTIGLALTGASILISAITIPVFLITGRRLKKQLEDEYGKKGRHGER